MGLTSNKPMPYCSPPMLAALKDIQAGKTISTGMLQSLRSRGWSTQKGVITEKGIAYLNSHS